MKLLHFISSLNRGGAEVILLQLVRELQQRGWQQKIVYLYEGPLLSELQGLGISCTQITAFGKYLNPVMWYRLVRVIRAVRPQVILTSLWAANLMGRVLGRLLGVPVVASLHAVIGHEGFLRTLIDRVVPGNPTSSIAASHSIAGSVRAHRTRYGHNLTVVPNGIDTAQFQAACRADSAVAVYQRTLGNFVVGAVGRLVPVKNFDRLITVFSQIAVQFPHARLLIIGTGPQEGKLRKLIAEQHYAAAITLISDQPATSYYRYFDCFVQPSTYEGLSVALLEALAMKLPVIVTGSISARPECFQAKRGNVSKGSALHHEVITDRVHGLVIPSQNDSALEQALIELIHNQTLAHKLGEQGYAKLRELYTAARMADGYEAVLKKFGQL
jgi:glycosyltransferase involved in cell wall biosynthesis